MDPVVTQVDDLEIASFIDRIALFAGAGCNPQQALKFCRSSMEGESSLCREVKVAAEAGGGNCAQMLMEVGKKLGSESLLFAAMAFSAHMRMGAEISAPLARLAEMVRWRHHLPPARDFRSAREIAVALFAYKMDILTEIGKSPKEVVALLAENDPVLGSELLEIGQDLESGYPLAGAFGRAADRMGSRGMKLLAAGLEVGDSTGAARSMMLRQTADAIRRELGD